MKRFVWISYDLGVRGDYEGMYAWLDKLDAKECGDSLAALWFEVKKDLVRELKAELDESITKDKRTRIYVIYLDPTTKKMKGAFVFGGRKAAPWTGFAGGVGEEDEGAV